MRQESGRTGTSTTEVLLTAGERPPQRQRRRIRPGGLTLLVMAAPGLTWLLVFAYLPLVGLQLAFKNYNYAEGMFGSPWIGLQNFQFIFSTGAARDVTLRTVSYNATFIIVNLVASVAVALLLNEVRRKWLTGVYQWVLFFPFFLSYPIIAYVVYAFLADDVGFVNHLLALLQVAPVHWYASANLWPFILVTVNLWRSLGFGAIIYLAGIQSISPEYYEAAMVDGAGKWAQIRLITLPLIRPMMIVLTLLAIGRIFYSDFGLFFNVPQNSPLLQSATETIDLYVYHTLTGASGGTIGMAAAASFYQSLVGFVLVVGANWIVRRISPEQALF